MAAIGHRLHDATEPPEELTKAQIEALKCIAGGDRIAAAAAKLGISESALKARITSARIRLMARTTAEAIQLYLDRLNEGGILVFHVSNRLYDLAQPLSVAAKALGLVGRYRVQGPDELKDAVGANPSMVVTLARTTEALGISATDPAWGPLPEPRIRPGTDDCANLLAAVQ